jgi:hypothetical protein
MKKYTLWALALIITVLAAAYQRRTGPTWPIEGSVDLGGTTYSYELERSHPGPTNHTVNIDAKGTNLTGILRWKLFNTDDPLKNDTMVVKEGKLIAELPYQKPGGKLAYDVVLENNGKNVTIPSSPAVIRFRGDVPLYVLLPHVLMMFLALLVSTRTGLEFFNKETNLKPYVWFVLGFLFLGGFVLGPLVQKFGFESYWTGVPFGYDLTDNKTLIMLIGWLVALYGIYKGKNPRVWALVAAVVMMLAYAIPHSFLGSERDPRTGKMKNEFSQVITVERIDRQG